MEDDLEWVSDNGLVSIVKVYTKSAKVATGGMNEVGCALWFW